jgi:hypothetical protein
VNGAQRFRAQAELCLRIARLMKDRAAADQLNAKAADYLAQAVELEINPPGASRNPVPIRGTAAVSFVALAFVRIDGGLVPSEEVECPLPGVAIRRAEAMSSKEANVGAVAFVRQGPDLDAFGDAVVLKTFGEVPENFDVD